MNLNSLSQIVLTCIEEERGEKSSGAVFHVECPSEVRENVIRDRDEINCEEDGGGDRQERVSGGEDTRGATGMS